MGIYGLFTTSYKRLNFLTIRKENIKMKNTLEQYFNFIKEVNSEKIGFNYYYFTQQLYIKEQNNIMSVAQLGEDYIEDVWIIQTVEDAINFLNELEAGDEPEEGYEYKWVEDFNNFISRGDSK